MDIKRISDDVAVSAQIVAGDVAAIAAAGFKSVICNRPDGESPDQTPYDEIAAAARAQGLVVHYQPVVSGRLTGGDVDEFGRLVAELPKPILAYCRSGARCTQLWNLSQSA